MALNCCHLLALCTLHTHTHADVVTMSRPSPPSELRWFLFTFTSHPFSFATLINRPSGWSCCEPIVDHSICWPQIFIRHKQTNVEKKMRFWRTVNRRRNRATRLCRSVTLSLRPADQITRTDGFPVHFNERSPHTIAWVACDLCVDKYFNLHAVPHIRD